MPYEFNLYALHDFDGDGIPELIMGYFNPNNYFFANYIVMKFDPYGDRFVTIGAIAESRYLMKDKYSNAIIGLYQDNHGGRNFKIYRNYYIANGNLSRNTQLAALTGTNDPAVYDHTWPVEIPPGYYHNDIKIDRDTFEQIEVSIRGSYDELIVHDWNGFNFEVATIAVRSWKPVTVSRRPILFTTEDRFTRTWQLPMYELIMAKRGPANTNIDGWSLNPAIRKERYQRYALYDIDGCGVPELLMAVQRGEKLSFDVYKYWNNDMRFIGSFDGYGKYIARARNGGVFAFNPVRNEFYMQSANRITFVNNVFNYETLLLWDFKDGRSFYRAPDANNRHLVSITQARYREELIRYAVTLPEIKTFDIDMVPPTGPLIMYIKTRAFTIQ
jgi:hypothetical protein